MVDLIGCIVPSKDSPPYMLTQEMSYSFFSVYVYLISLSGTQMSPYPILGNSLRIISCPFSAFSKREYSVKLYSVKLRLQDKY